MSKITLMLVAAASLLPAAFFQNAEAQDSYSAKVVTGSTSAQQIQFNFTITKYTAEAELK